MTIVKQPVLHKRFLSMPIGIGSLIGIDSLVVVVVVVGLLFYVHDKHLRSCRDKSVYLTTLFLGRLRPPKRLTSTSCTYFRR